MSLLGGGGTHSSARIALQEVEFRLSAIVDPYLRADITLAGNAEDVGFEEAYLTTLSIPFVNIRAGQILANFGRHNTLHTHAFPFLTAPLPWQALLGDEGLRGPGISADVLFPLPIFSELNLQAFNGGWLPMDQAEEALSYLGHLKVLLELGAPTTLEFGGSYAGGRNGFDQISSVVGGDLTLRWRPIEAERYTSFEWTTEYLWVDHQGAPAEQQRSGAYTAVRYQFGQRWWIQARGAVLDGDAWRGEALFALIPSELSALRLQYAIERPEAQAPLAHEVLLQAVVSIGSHPAHAY